MTNVDKAVCTNDVLEDLNRAIKFETVFSTLIENKILAIKRECEEKQKSKRSRSFARFLFGRRLLLDSQQTTNAEQGQQAEDGVNIELPQTTDPRLLDEIATNEIVTTTVNNGIHHSHLSPQNDPFASVTENGRHQPAPLSPPPKPLDQMSAESVSLANDYSIGSGGIGVSMRRVHGTAKSDEIVVDLNEYDTRPASTTISTSHQLPASSDLDFKYDVISIRSDMCRTGGIIEHHSYSRKATVGHNASALNSSQDKRSQSDDFIARTNNSTNLISSSISNARRSGRAHKTRFKDYVVEIENQDETGQLEMGKRQPKVNSKSILSSSSSSLQSTPVDFKPPTMITSTSSPTNTTNSNSLRFNAREASLVLEQERLRLRVLEAKSISAQCSPIMPRHSDIDNIANISNSAPHSLNPYFNDEPQSLSLATDSGKVVVETTSEKVNHHRSHHSHKQHHHTGKKSKKLIAAEFVASQLDYGSLVNYEMVNPMTQGIISSFNQLKSPNLPAVIASANSNASAGVNATTSKLLKGAAATTTSVEKGGKNGKEGKKSKMFQRMPSTTSTGGDSSTVANTGCCVRKSTKKPTASGHVANDAREEEENTNKHNLSHRYSDPILIYPSSGGMQHCILSRPPNQPIEFHYNNDDFVYDVSLQIEKGGGHGGGTRLEAINPSKPHRHHRHKHKHKHKHDHGTPDKTVKKKKKKRKILVHDLERQIVKVIDPDDLPQKARWTIIATACLLLIMCLLLVGVTLRMAPIIDDMALCATTPVIQERRRRATKMDNSISINNNQIAV